MFSFSLIRLVPTPLSDRVMNCKEDENMPINQQCKNNCVFTTLKNKEVFK